MTRSECDRDFSPIECGNLARVRKFRILFLAICLSLAVPTSAQNTAHRQVFLGLIYHVKAADAGKFVESNRKYSAALASHNISNPLMHWSAYRDENTFRFLWLYPIEQLNDIEELSKIESALNERINTEKWEAGADLHYAVDHTEEFVMRDEPSLSRLPSAPEVWSHQFCEFQLYYTSGGYGGSDSDVRELWRKYLGTFPKGADRTYYRVLRVLIGLERPLWVVQHCGVSGQQVREQKSEEAKLTGAAGANAQHSFLSLVRKIEVWPYQFEAGLSYPLESNQAASPQR